MRVVVTELARVIEQIDRITARFAQEELGDSPIHNGMNWGTPRLHDIDGLMAALTSGLIESVVKVFRGEANNRRRRKRRSDRKRSGKE
jgi:hypothetical protein